MQRVTYAVTADRMWAGRDVEMIIIAASSAYRNDSVRDLDLSVQRLLGKWGNRFLMDLRGCSRAGSTAKTGTVAV